MAAPDTPDRDADAKLRSCTFLQAFEDKKQLPKPKMFGLRFGQAKDAA